MRTQLSQVNESRVLTLGNISNHVLKDDHENGIGSKVRVSQKVTIEARSSKLVRILVPDDGCVLIESKTVDVLPGVVRPSKYRSTAWIRIINRKERNHILMRNQVVGEAFKVMEVSGLHRLFPEQEGCPAVVFVKKEDGSCCMCIDYRKSNVMTNRGSYPLPSQGFVKEYGNQRRENWQGKKSVVADTPCLKANAKAKTCSEISVTGNLSGVIDSEKSDLLTNQAQVNVIDVKDTIRDGRLEDVHGNSTRDGYFMFGRWNSTRVAAARDARWNSTHVREDVRVRYGQCNSTHVRIRDGHGRGIASNVVDGSTRNEDVLDVRGCYNLVNRDAVRGSTLLELNAREAAECNQSRGTPIDGVVD